MKNNEIKENIITLDRTRGNLIAHRPYPSDKKLPIDNNTIKNKVSSLLSGTIMPASIKTLSEDDFPESQIEKHLVDGAIKTVVHIPQIHKEPTTDMSDSKNNTAVIIQGDIQKSLDELVNKYDVDCIMDETDVYWPMPSEKVEKVKNALNDIDQFKKSFDRTLKEYLNSGGSKEYANTLKQEADEQIVASERQIKLTGGAAMEAALNNKAHVWGSQNPDTLQKAKDGLTDVVHLQQRIAQLEKGQHATATASQSSSASSFSSILKMLSGNRTSGGDILGYLRSFALDKDNEKLLNSIQDTQSKLTKMTAKKDLEATPKLSQSNMKPSKYSSRTDLANLKNEYKLAQDQFMKIAKDIRNVEVIENVVKMMDKNNVNNATLIYGSGHKEDIVPGLNTKGISVIVVQPKSSIKAS